VSRRAGFALLVALLALAGPTSMSPRAGVHVRLSAGVEWLAGTRARIDAKIRRERPARVVRTSAPNRLVSSQTPAHSVHTPLVSLQLPPPAAAL
jgi:hypothetical protein